MKWTFTLTLSLALLLVSPSAYAHFPRQGSSWTSPVGLGITSGTVVSTSYRDSYFSFSGGFYTDIPLLETFHITPSTTVYRYKGESATDISLNFKFIVPLEQWEAMGGITAGLTSTDSLVPHVGVFGGVAYNFVSNLDWFVNVGYNHVFLNSASHNVSISTGPLFRFR